MAALTLFDSIWGWLAPAVMGGLAVFIGAWVSGLLGEALPSPRDIVAFFGDFFRKRAPGTHFTILVSALNHDPDPDGGQTRYVINALRAIKGIEVLPTRRALKIDPNAPQSTALAEAEERGRRWLKKRNADILVWGEVVKADEALHLWFTGATHKAQTGSSPYALEKFWLPLDFQEDIATQLVAVALSQIRPVTEEQGTYLVEILRPVAKKMKILLAKPPPTLTPSQKTDLNHSLGLAAAMIGEQTGESRWLKEAVAAYRKALKGRPRARVPLDWAKTQNNLGNALASLGEREQDTARLKAAVAAYREALKEWTRARAPLEWAIAQTNMGNALMNLGKCEHDTARLKEAVAAHREALKELTRALVPLQWAITQNNLGSALARLGQCERGTARLKAAVAAYREALKEFNRELVPLNWASVQNNLGEALQSLGERERGTARLKKAVTAYRAALDVFGPAGASRYVDGTEENLRHAEALLKERTK